MQKNLLRYPWIFAAVTAGIFFCLAFILHLIFSGNTDAQDIHSGAQLVREAVYYALL